MLNLLMLTKTSFEPLAALFVLFLHLGEWLNEGFWPNV